MCCLLVDSDFALLKFLTMLLYVIVQPYEDGREKKFLIFVKTIKASLGYLYDMLTFYLTVICLL